MHLTTSQNAFTNRPARPLLQKILPLRGADCSALRRTMSFMGGGAPKKAAGKNEKYKTRSSPRWFWNSRSRSSILNGAPVRQLAMLHWRLGSSGFCRRSTLRAGRGLSHAPGGDRVGLAPRPQTHLDLREQAAWLSTPCTWLPRHGASGAPKNRGFVEPHERSSC